jgi:putative hemolysin
MTSIATEIVLIACLLLLNGVLAMSEIAIVSARKARLRQQAESGDQGAAAALALANEPTRFLSTVQVGITLVGILAGAFGGATIAEQIGAALETYPPLAPYGEAIGLGVVVLAITYFSLVVGELVPKRIGLNSPERIASRVARPMRVLSSAAGPLVSVLTISTDLVLRLLQVKPSQEAAISEEEVRVLIAQGTEAGIFEEAERELVESAFELGETRVEALMTPRPLVTWLDASEPADSAWQKLSSSPHSYYPVCRGELDHVLGVLSLRELAQQLLAGQRPKLADLAQQPLFIPEQSSAFRALEQFKQVGSRLALVLDEHGGIAGVLTPTDVLEALVGDLAPQEGEEQIRPVRREDGSWLLDGLMPLDEAADVLDLKHRGREEDKDIQTLGGLAMAALGRIPTAGDRFDWRGRRFEVVDMDGRRVDKVLALGEPLLVPNPVD